MTYDQAQKILDRVRDGVPYPARIIDFALQLTGDLDAHEAYGGQGMATEIPDESPCRWSGIGSGVVGQGYCRH